MPSGPEMRSKDLGQGLDRWRVTFGVCFVALPLLVLYSLTAYPGVTGGDSGELLAEACLGGTAHPPGYPLYTMLLNLVMRLKPRVDGSDRLAYVPELPGVYNKAHMANLCSGLMGSVSALLLYLTAATLLTHLRGGGVSLCGPALGALVYSLCPLTWEYHTQAEVFALNNLLLATLCYLSVRVWVYGRVGEALLGAWLCGLALANQHAALLFLVVLCPGVLTALLWAPPSPQRPQRSSLANAGLLLSLSICFLLGLSPYGYLYASATNGPTPGSWGDLTSWRGLVRHVLRQEYGTFKLGVASPGPSAPLVEGMWHRIMVYLGHAHGDTGGVGVGVAGLALGMLLWPRGRGREKGGEEGKEREKGARGKGAGEGTGEEKGAGEEGAERARWALWTLVGAWGSYVLLWHAVLSNLPLSLPLAFAVHARFYLQPNLVLLGLLPGLLLDTLLPPLLNATHRVKREPSSAADSSVSPSKKRLQEGLSCTAVGGMVLLLLCHPEGLVRRYSNARGVQAHGGTIHRYGEALLWSLPRHSLLLAHTDLNWNPVRYHQACEGLRPDVTHLSFQLLPYPWFATRQAPLYPAVTFPPLPQHVSTHRHHPSNAALVSSMSLANLGQCSSPSSPPSPACPFPGGVYLDQMSINDQDLGAGGSYHKGAMSLVPWGMLYRAQPPLSTLRESERWHPRVLRSIQRLANHTTSAQEGRGSFCPSPSRVFGEGTWEYAAASTHDDAIYQAALYLLTYAVETDIKAQGGAALQAYVEALRQATHLLDALLHKSSSECVLTCLPYDVLKNSLLAATRLQESRYWLLQKRALWVLSSLTSNPNRPLETPLLPLALSPSLGTQEEGRLTLKEEEQASRQLAARLTDRFVREYPRDPHVSTFKKAIQDMDSPRSVLEKGEKMSGGGGGGSAKGEEGREKPPAKRRKRGKARAGDTGEEL